MIFPFQRAKLWISIAQKVPVERQACINLSYLPKFVLSRVPPSLLLTRNCHDTACFVSEGEDEKGKEGVRSLKMFI